MRYLHLLVTVLLATPLAAQDLPAPGDYRQAVTRATGLYIDAMATVSESIEALVAAVARRAWTMRSIVMAAAEAYFRTSPASCKDRKQSPALAIAVSQDRKLGRDGRIQAISDI